MKRRQFTFKKRLLPIAIFYAISCSIAWPIFLNMERFQDILRPLDISFINPFLLIMWGPGIAALIVYALFGKKIKKTYSIFGKNIVLGIIFFIFPWIINLCLNLLFPQHESFSFDKLLLIIPVSFVFTLGEELGWRGFLQDALQSVPRYIRWGIVALLWELWHIRFMWIDESIGRGIMKTAVFFLGTILLSVILGESQRKTRVLLIPITIHIWVNMLFQTPNWISIVTLLLSAIIWYRIIIKTRCAIEIVN